MTTGSNFWVIGGEFGSMNFHKLVEGSAQVKGPFKTRKEAEDCWREVSEENRHKAGVRFSIVEEPSRVMAYADPSVLAGSLCLSLVSGFSLEHDRFGRPLHTFPDRALSYCK